MRQPFAAVAVDYYYLLCLDIDCYADLYRCRMGLMGLILLGLLYENYLTFMMICNDFGHGIASVRMSVAE